MARSLRDYVTEYGSMAAAYNAFWEGRITDDPDFENKFLSVARCAAAVVWRCRHLGWTSATDAAASYIRVAPTSAADILTLQLIESWAPTSLAAAAARVMHESVRR